MSKIVEKGRAYQQALPGSLVSTGYKKMDKALGGGLRRGIHTILGRSGIGKTTLVLNIVCNILQQGYGVIFFSLEMEEAELYDKILEAFDAETRDTYETDRIVSEFESGLTVYDEANAGNMSEDSIRQKIEDHMKTELKPKVIVIDYLQYPDSDNAKASAERMISMLSAMSKKFDLIVLALSSISNSMEKLPGMDFQGKETGKIKSSSQSMIGMQLKVIDDHKAAYPISSDKISAAYDSAGTCRINADIIKIRKGGIPGARVEFTFRGSESRFLESGSETITHEVSDDEAFGMF